MIADEFPAAMDRGFVAPSLVMRGSEEEEFPAGESTLALPVPRN